MTFASLYWSEQYISSGLAAVLSATGPMMILLIQAKRNREKLQKEQLVAFYCTNRCYICFFTRNASTSKFHMEYCLYCFSYRGAILRNRLYSFEKKYCQIYQMYHHFLLTVFKCFMEGFYYSSHLLL